jgi:hypothetical protein
MSEDPTTQTRQIQNIQPDGHGRQAQPCPEGTAAYAAPRTAWLWRALLSSAVLAVLALTLHSLVLSNASFTAKSTNPANVFVAGSLLHSNDQGGKVMLTATGVTPGYSDSAQMIVTGGGTVAGDYTLNVSSLVDTPASPTSPALSGVLELTVEDTTAGTTPVDGVDVADLVPVSLGTIAPLEQHTFLVTLDYPDGPNQADLQGASMSLTLQVLGVTP